MHEALVIARCYNDRRGGLSWTLRLSQVEQAYFDSLGVGKSCTTTTFSYYPSIVANFYSGGYCRLRIDNPCSRTVLINS